MDEKTLAEHIYYAENLSAAVGELAVTQAELAKAIGKDQKTVGRYINGETYPEGCVAQIAEYLLSRLVVENEFAHIPSDKFEQIFSEIYDFLNDNGIREAEFAKTLGISQKTLNNYHNYRINNGEAVRLTTEMQGKIISAFYKLGKDFFPYNSEDDDSNQSDVRNRFENISYKISRSREHTVSVGEMWQLLIDSCKNGGANFFVYAPEKLRLVCFYLRLMVSELDRIKKDISHQIHHTGECRDYFFREEIASLDFLWGPHEDLSENFGIWTENDDQTPNFWCDLVCRDIERNREAYAAFSPRERDETNAFLRSVYNTKTRKIIEDRDYLKANYTIPSFEYVFNEEKSGREKISSEELDELVKLFAVQSPGLQEAILHSFDVFFWGISFDNLDKVLAAHKQLAATQGKIKLKIIKRFEAELMSDFWKTGCKLDNDYYDKYFDINPGLWNESSQYLRLMSFARTEDLYRFEPPSEKYTAAFRKRSRYLAKDIDPVFILKTQIDYSAMEWYVNMLVDIALLKERDFEEMLREIENI